MGDAHWRNEEEKYSYWATVLRELRRSRLECGDRTKIDLLDIADYLEEGEAAPLVTTLKEWAKLVFILTGIALVFTIFWWGQAVRIDRDEEHTAAMALIERQAAPIPGKNSVDGADSVFDFNACLLTCEHRANDE